MLNFDPDRYLSIQNGAVGTSDALGAIAEVELDRGIDNVLFLGAGGAGILMEPAAELLASRSTLSTRRMVGGELIANGSTLLNDRTLAVVPSLSGTTPDAIDQIEFLRAAGARILALVGASPTPVSEAADYVVTNAAADDTSCESFYLQSQILAAHLLDKRGEWDGAAQHLKALPSVPEALLATKREFEDLAPAWAQHLADHDWHIITSSGPSWTEAYYYGMCILEEMQWIRTRPVHAYDFFHGTLELVEPGVSVMILKGEGPTRPMDERVERFSREITDQTVVLDTTGYPMGSVAPEHRHLTSHIWHAAILERVSAHLEVIRDHPLTTRRYYRRRNY